jgi:2-oxoglutarate ferredoxin oxidoreductase subunit delta
MPHRIYIQESRCKGVDGCGLCIHVCPKNVYEKSGRLTDRGVYPPAAVDIERCTACKLCMMYCPDLAIVIEPDGSSSGKDT